MAFMNNGNGGFNNHTQNNNGGEPKKKSNFRVGRLYGEDGILDISTWNSDKGGTYAVLNIKSAIGKDPSTGMNAYEQKMASELPSVFMNSENVCALIMALKQSKPEDINLTLDCGRSKLTMLGSGNTYKMTIENQKTGSRTITMKAIPVGPVDIHASYKILTEQLELCYKKAIRAKLDADEFGMALTGETTDEDAPF